MFVGPSECGKTYFAEKVLIPQLQRQNRHIYKTLNIQHLSSDHFRRDMLGVNYNSMVDEKDDKNMDFVSEQAFTMLKTKLAAVLSYPVNADFIIVDTTGMSENFRKEVAQITNDANYSLQLIVFDYKNRDDYFKHLGGEHSRTKAVSDSIRRFKDKLFELSKKEYPNQSKVKSINFSEIVIEIENFQKFSEHFLNPNSNYIIIGDVHGCYDELMELLLEHGYTFHTDDNSVRTNLQNTKIIFIGDLVDKGDQIPEVINFVHYLVKSGEAFLVRGNHENFVFNYLKGVKPYTELGEEFIKSFIQSVDIFNADPELKEKFFELFDLSKDFYATDRFIATHAPCKIEYLGKVRGHCLKHQRNFRFARRREFNTEEEFTTNAEKEMAFMKEESRYNNPYHIVGHVMLPNVVQFNNKFMIDTGCVAGGKLTSIEIPISGQPRFKSVKSRRESTGEIFPLFIEKKRFDLSELEPKEQTRIKFLCLEKVNFISGTMAPADKDVGNNTLESLNQAIMYYKNAGVKSLIMQPKYMGSRGNVYLFKDVAQSYVVTRNGYRVKDSVMELLRPVIANLAERIFPKVFVNKNVKLIILDAEILPWNLIGGGLIDNHFRPVSLAVESESKLLEEHGFENILESFKKREDYQQYLEDRKNEKKDALTEKYGHTKERTFRNLYDYNHLSLSEEMKYSNNFKSQLELHGSESAAVDIQPFAILKVVLDDDSEFLFENESNIAMYRMVSDRPFAVLNFDEDERLKNFKSHELAENDYHVSLNNVAGAGKSLNTSNNFYDHITRRMGMEGIVIKPEKVYTPGIAPYIKVRNEDYLTIVYGHNYKFEKKFDKLIKKKGVKKKLQTSIKEFELGMKMLRTPYNKITTDNEEYKQLLAQMIIEVEKEKQLDPRL